MGSYSQTVQKDNRLVAESAELVSAPESALALPGGVALQNVTGSEISYVNNFPEEVQNVVNSLLSSTEKNYAKLMGITEQAIAGVFAQTAEAQETAKQGEIGKYIEFFPYIIVAVIGFLILKR